MADHGCSIAGTLEIIGDRWTILILRDAFRGVRRFDEIQQDLGIARNVLTDRLTKRVDLSPALVALMRWGDKHIAGEDIPTVLVHDSCGKPLDQTFICWDCDTTVEPTAIRSRPGARAASSERGSRRQRAS